MCGMALMEPHDVAVLDLERWQHAGWGMGPFCLLAFPCFGCLWPLVWLGSCCLHEKQRKGLLSFGLRALLLMVQPSLLSFQPMAFFFFCSFLCDGNCHCWCWDPDGHFLLSFVSFHLAFLFVWLSDWAVQPMKCIAHHNTWLQPDLAILAPYHGCQTGMCFQKNKEKQHFSIISFSLGWNDCENFRSNFAGEKQAWMKVHWFTKCMKMQTAPKTMHQVCHLFIFGTPCLPNWFRFSILLSSKPWGHFPSFSRAILIFRLYAPENSHWIAKRKWKRKRKGTCKPQTKGPLALKWPWVHVGTPKSGHFYLPPTPPRVEVPPYNPPFPMGEEISGRTMGFQGSPRLSWEQDLRFLLFFWLFFSPIVLNKPVFVVQNPRN